MIFNDHCFGLALLTQVLALCLETLPDKHASSLRIKQNDIKKSRKQTAILPEYRILHMAWEIFCNHLKVQIYIKLN